MNMYSKAEMKGFTNTADLLELADQVDTDNPGNATKPAWVLNRTAKILRQFAEQQPEEPKVESLREAAERFRNRDEANSDEDAADLCALVLGRVDRVWEWLDRYIADDISVDLVAVHDLKRERAEIAQMRKGV